MAIGTFRVELDSGTIYRGNVEVLDFSPQDARYYSGSSMLALRVTEVDIIRTQKKTEEVEECASMLVNAIWAAIKP